PGRFSASEAFSAAPSSSCGVLSASRPSVGLTVLPPVSVAGAVLPAAATALAPDSTSSCLLPALPVFALPLLTCWMAPSLPLKSPLVVSTAATSSSRPVVSASIGSLPGRFCASGVSVPSVFFGVSLASRPSTGSTFSV
ncbi:MAG: hypothetical protein MK138_03195, partial [Planctomycetes bacterium]|nr:hypothetical protein [Planctomycetota bacterium]